MKHALHTARIRNRLHSFDSVTTLREFLAGLTRDQLPVLFILDLHVSGAESGLDFLRWLRQQEGPVQSTPAMMLSGSERPKDHEECRALGSMVFLQKPVNETTLTDAIEALGFTIGTNLTSGEVGFRILERPRSAR